MNKELLDVINLNDLNDHNAEMVECGHSPVSMTQAYEKVEELVNGYAEDLAEQAREKAYRHIERFIEYNWRCYEGNNLQYADTGELVVAIAEKAKEELF